MISNTFDCQSWQNSFDFKSTSLIFLCISFLLLCPAGLQATGLNFSGHDRGHIRANHLNSVNEIEASSKNNLTVDGKIVAKLVRRIDKAIIVFKDNRSVAISIDEGDIEIGDLIEEALDSASDSTGSKIGWGLAKSAWKALPISKPWKYGTFIAGWFAAGRLSDRALASGIVGIVMMDAQGHEATIKFADSNLTDIKVADDFNLLNIVDSSILENRPTDAQTGNSAELNPIETTEELVIYLCLSSLSVFFLIFSLIKLMAFVKIRRGRSNVNRLASLYNRCTEKIDKRQSKITDKKKKIEAIDEDKPVKKKNFLRRILPAGSSKKKRASLTGKVISERSKISELKKERRGYYENLSRYVAKGRKRSLFKFQIKEILKNENTGQIEVVLADNDSFPDKEPPRAPLLKRMVAFGLDVAFVSLIVWVLSCIPFLEMTTDGIIMISFLGLIFYAAIFNRSPIQATVGKRIMGIYVRDNLGYQKSFFELLYREITKYLILILSHGLILLWTLIFPKKPTFHDYLGRTVVLKQS